MQTQDRTVDGYAPIVTKEVVEAKASSTKSGLTGDAAASALQRLWRRRKSAGEAELGSGMPTATEKTRKTSKDRPGQLMSKEPSLHRAGSADQSRRSSSGSAPADTVEREGQSQRPRRMSFSSPAEQKADIKKPLPPVALVTGAASGIGKALMWQLVKGGTNVIAVDKDSQKLDEIQKDKRVSVCVADIGTAEGVAAVQKAVGAQPLKILAYVAGCFAAKALLRMDRHSMNDMIGCHMYGPVFLTQSLVNNLKLVRQPRILLTSSSGADTHIPTFGGYGATKKALHSLWMALRDECSEYASVGLCNPGITKTPFWDRHLADPKWIFRPVFASRFKGRDFHTAEEAAEWMAALLDDRKINATLFKDREHIIDNPEHQLGVKITLTTEGKGFRQSK